MCSNITHDPMFSHDREALPRHPVDSTLSWGLADVLVGAFLFFGTFAFVLWQNTHLTSLADFSYILEYATRISLGQLPYRDFPFPYPPLTFLVQAAIIKLFGRVVLYHYLYAAVLSAIASLITWRILLRLLVPSRLPKRLTAFLLVAPLIFLGTSSIFPHPFYDADCTFVILFCIWLLLRVESANFPRVATFACGFLLVVPLFVKQNTGLAFLLSAVFCIAYYGILNRRASILLLAGATTGFACALAVIQRTAGLRNYLHWTIQFAASRRMPGLRIMVVIYWKSALLWIFLIFIVVFGRFMLRRAARLSSLWLASALLSVPFLWAFAALFLHADASGRVAAFLRLWPLLLIASFAVALWQLPRATTLAHFLPFVLLGTINGALLSQQVSGSTYAIWPLLLILVATILVALAPSEQAKGFLTKEVAENDDSQPSIVPLIVFTSIASLVLIITGSYYALSHVRFDYVDLSGDTLAHSELPALRGLAMRGNWLPDFEELVAYTSSEIPRGDAIFILPGEDLFYFTTGRTPQFPILMVHDTVNPYSAVQLVQLARQHNVRWLVVKRRLQLHQDPITFRPQLLELFYQDFEPAQVLNNYDIYRRKQH